MSPFEFSIPMASFYEPAQPSLVPLFRLLDEWERASQQTQAQPQTQASKQAPAQAQQQAHRQSCPALAQNKRPQPQVQTPAPKRQVRPVQRFTPRFDVRETDAAYELYGELPGASRENLNIEFTEPQTIVISGKVERRAVPVVIPVPTVPQIEAAPEPAVEEERPRSPYQATVEDTDDEEFETLSQVSSLSSRRSSRTVEPEKKEKEVAVTEAEAQKQHDSTQQQEEEQGRYLLQERSVGEFLRTFNLPARVDCDAVSASLENGILAVTIPKQAKHTPITVRIN